MLLHNMIANNFGSRSTVHLANDNDQNCCYNCSCLHVTHGVLDFCGALLSLEMLTLEELNFD